ncbi:secretin N-terminal domain-containing protein [Botrimarina mediterranea]|uniref:Bacterial type II/III secretion system short domain protein n=1 Tax=Botrimarina mediterranea TaxID=2528022 RepID=A0A518K6E3_9BACT|nr:secretin N-terminal domain-containing protein [Botrimarina mediterranea]QDV73350.1 Bacterial type II/III secretion system short domain protein [Botrimarina mediterranea]QDV77867.1 Bacterial type II/III secretion system short domain protein [Planctomycetes bacterium K2D]
MKDRPPLGFLTPDDMPLRRQLLTRLATALLVAVFAVPALGAESEIVGLLAVALEPAVAKDLGLSDDQLGKLQALADEREMKGMTQAMKVANLPRDEQVAQLADFRAESERMAFEVLTAEQTAKLRDVARGRDDAALEPVEKESTAEDAEVRDTVITAPSSDPSKEESAEESEQDEVAEEESAARPLSGETPAVATTIPNDGKLSFNFKQQPWADVIRWFADQAGLSLIVDQTPPGTLTYRDDRRYTPAEALDVLNGVLLTKGYTLVRKDRMLLVIDLEQDVIPPNVVTDVPLEQLDERGEYELVRVLVELGDVDATTAADSLLRLVGPQGAVVVLPEAKMLQITEAAGRIRTMIAVIDAMKRAATPVMNAEAELRSYPLGGADGATALAILQTLLEGTGSARLAVDQQTGSLIALATPSEHLAIQQTLEKLQTDGRRVDVIPVKKVNPTTAAALVNRLFNPTVGDAKTRDPNAPVIEADRYSDALLVRGTADQVRQVRELVSQLDESDTSAETTARGPVRTLPISGPELQRALEQIETLWPTYRENPLRVTNPGQGIPSFRPGAEVERELEQGDDPLDMLYGEPASQEQPPRRSTKPNSRTTSAPTTGSPFRFAAQPGEVAEETDGAEPIYISPGVGSTVIASRDAEALDALEDLLASVLDMQTTGGKEYAVYYLKFSEATTAAALLTTIFGGDSGGGGGSLMGDLAGAAMGGGAGGDLVGDLLGMGGGATDSVGFSSVSVDIVPDVRLNALYVYATPQDLQTVNRLLRVIDQPRGPDRIESVGVPRLIKLYNTEVSDVATVVRQVFEDRIGSSAGGGGQPSPQELLRALQGGEKGANDQEPEKMSIGIDERSNSLVVRSSEPLFEEVKTLVEQLDRAGVERPVSTRVVSLRNTGSEALKETLVSLLGDKAVVSGETPAAQNDQSRRESGRGESNNNNDDADRQRREMQQRIERFRDFQRTIERMRGGGGGGRGGRGGGGPPGGGRGGR